MSHLTKAKIEIKDLGALRRAAERLGGKVTEEKKSYEERYTGNVESVMAFEYQGGRAYVTQELDGEYKLTIDNYGNPITQKIGRDCALLGREYATTIVEDQALAMGGVILSQDVQKDGSVHIELSV